MQKLIVFFSFVMVAMSCSNQKAEPASATEPAASPKNVTLPYEASYSSSFEMGNPEYSATILQGSWKDWETNHLENMKNWVADTITAMLSDNSMVKGVDSLMARWKRGRTEYTFVIDSISAVIPVYSTDRKENWVLVWAYEINTKTNGIKDTTGVMETWRINKDGKADLLLQYDRANRKK